MRIVHSLQGLFSALDYKTGTDVVYNAGHYALVPGPNDDVIPGIWQDVQDRRTQEWVRGHPYMGDFPVQTFSAACQLAQNHLKDARQVRFVLLVNDWQSVPKAEDGQPNRLRAAYYKIAELPQSFKQLMARYGIQQDQFVPRVDLEGNIMHPFAWSEMALRTQYQRRHRAVCSLKHGCAQEAMPLLSHLFAARALHVVNFIPYSCQEPWEAGTLAALEQPDTEDQHSVHNIYICGREDNFWHNTQIITHTSG